MKVKLVVLVQGLLLAALCDGRARKPEMEEDLEDVQDYGSWDGGYGTSDGALGRANHHTDPQYPSPDISGSVHIPPNHGHIGPSHGHANLGLSEGTGDASAETDTHGVKTRTGNWCAFVHKRVVTIAVACSNETYTIKSQSPCPNGTPDCQLIMYKLSTRPVYREKQKIFTALLWRCCPGHGGKNCDETVADGHVSHPEDPSMPGRLHPGGLESHHAGPRSPPHGENQEQNDHDDPSSSQYLGSKENQTEENSYDYNYTPNDGREHHNERADPYGVAEEHRRPPSPAPYPTPELLPIHYIKDIIMSQLQPVLDRFNSTLEHLSQEVKNLQKDMAELQVNNELETESEVEGGGAGEELLQHEDKLANTFQQLEELSMQLSLQRDEMEERLHAQQAMLHFNLTSLKIDLDVKFKRSQKMLQANLQFLNSSLSEVKQEQERLEQESQTVLAPERTTPWQEKPEENTAVWEAINRLDNKVVNNTVSLSALNEEQVKISQNIEHIQGVLKTQDDRITKTDRKSEDRYIEAFLEVDGVKTEVQTYIQNYVQNYVQNNVQKYVQNYVQEKTKNISTTLQDMEVDVDYLFTTLYKNVSSDGTDCNCKALSTSMAQLKQDMADIAELANQNRLALDGAAEERLGSFAEEEWRPSVEDLKLGLQNVQNSLAFEQEKSRTLQQNVSMLHATVSGNRLDIEGLQRQNIHTASDIKRLFSSFGSLLNDVVRHSEVLEILLGEEVLIVMEWPAQQQKAQSIPALQEKIEDMQEQINGHSKSLASMLNSAPPEDTAADEPSVMADWVSLDASRGQGHQKFVRFSEGLPDYTDSEFSVLEKSVEQLRSQIVKLEEQRCLSCCNCMKGAAPADMEVRLQAELSAMRKRLEDHLQIFSSVFTNIEGLAGSDATVDLDKLHSLMKRKHTKQQKKRQVARTDGRVGQPVGQPVEHLKHRSKRDASLETAVLSQLPDSPLMFLASRRGGVNESGLVIFETASLNRGQMYSPKTGTFRAPVSGVYLFVLTLDFGPGPSLAQLKRGEEVAASLHQSQRKPSGPATRVCLLQLEQGEELQLQIVQGTLEQSNPQDNTFAGLLILQTT